MPLPKPPTGASSGVYQAPVLRGFPAASDLRACVPFSQPMSMNGIEAVPEPVLLNGEKHE
jgi:hypothetical protein